ncbi:MAG: NAD(P)H-dependent oxidoreductase [Muribaculaceae bacterium]|nr:NAD(P)H-dependent oxidoreductase [Muribaculaceae bacterium]
MKVLKLMMLIALAMMVATSCNPKKEAPKSKVLVLYYSLTSNTKTLAQEIATRLDADIEEITLVEPYDTAFQATIDRCKADREKGILPEIKPLKSNIADYDRIFIGYPIWFGTYAPPIASLLDKIDLSDKWVVPFCTFGSGGLESSVKDLTEKQPNAKVLPGYGVRAARMNAMPKELENFLKRYNALMVAFDPANKENKPTESVFMPADFPEQHPVSADEAAIFDAAVNGYPMLNAKAKTVASRSIPEGTEYLFTAMDKPREDKPDMPPASEIKVYVIVEKGKSPEFTRVVR